MVKEFTVRTHDQVEFLAITNEVQKIVSESGQQNGICHVYVPHTTAGVTINEGADPDVTRDMIMELNKIVPFEDGYLHAEGNSAAHIKTSMMGNSSAIIIENGRLVLGTWQTVYFCEFDGPRSRRVYIHIG
jgi:secondary thiamine-phosphate synthase enzyme